MGVVFAVLVILALSIRAFDRIDSLIPEAGASQAVTTAATTTAPPTVAQDQTESGSDNANVAAAIAVALALAEADGSALASSTSVSSRTGAAQQSNTWVSAGRSREMSARSANLRAGRGQGR